MKLRFDSAEHLLKFWMVYSPERSRFLGNIQETTGGTLEFFPYVGASLDVAWLKEIVEFIECKS